MSSTQCLVAVYRSIDNQPVSLDVVDSLDKGNALCDTIDLMPEVQAGTLYYDVEVRRLSS